MPFVNQMRYKAFITDQEREDTRTCCEYFLILCIIVCSMGLFIAVLDNTLHGQSDREAIKRSLWLVRRVEANMLKVSAERAAVDRLIDEIREDLSKIHSLIHRSAWAEHPQTRPEINFKICEDGTNDPDSKAACEIARLNNGICSKIFKNLTQRKPVKILEEARETAPLVTMSPSGQIIKVVKGNTDGNDPQSTKSYNQNGEFDTFPKRIRRAANPNPEETPQADDFWFNYAVDRQTSCKVPKQGLKTAEILCKIWPKSITCHTYCIYGSTYPEGIVRTLNCSYNKNRWSDYFEECQPFVNCKLRLIGPGTLKCMDNVVNRSPTCHIGCEDYEDKDGTPAQTYECKADGTWSPPLPPCVIKKSGVDLVKAPEVLEHASIEYPKVQGTK